MSDFLPTSLKYKVTQAKGQMTQRLTELKTLLTQAKIFQEPLIFPDDVDESFGFAVQTATKIDNLTIALREQLERVETSLDYGQKILDNQVDEALVETIMNQIKVHFDTNQTPQFIQETSQVLQILVLRQGELEARRRFVLEQAEFKFNIAQKSKPQTNPAQMDTNQMTEVFKNLTLSLQHNQDLSHVYGKTFKLPDFTGNPAEYSNFIALFDELVDKRSQNDLEKLSVLISHCVGDAKTAMEFVPRTPEGYKLARNRLKTLFGDSYAIRNLLIKQINELEKASSDSSSLLKTLTNLQTIISRMEANGDEINSGLIQRIAIEKFPQKVRDNVSDREFEYSRPLKMREFLLLLEQEVKKTVHRQAISESNQIQVNASNVLVQTTPNDLSKCVGCGSNYHFFKNCQKYKSPSEKRNRVRILNRCRVCFKRGHISAKCRLPPCSLCKGDHCYYLCDQYRVRISRRDQFNQHKRSRSRGNDRSNSRYRYRSSSQNAPRNQSHNSRDYSQSPRYQHQRSKSRPSRTQSRESQSSSRSKSRQRSQSRSNEYNVMVTTTNIQNKSVKVNETTQLSLKTPVQTQMKIVQVFIKDENTGELIKKNALLDAAAQTSFILEDTSKELSLIEEPAANLGIISFNSKPLETHTRAIETILYNQDGEEFPITLFTTKTITSKIDMTPICQKDLKFLQRNKIDTEPLRKLYGQRILPELLIGLDLYDKVTCINEPQFQLPSGLYARPSSFGYVISGITKDDGKKSIEMFTTLVNPEKFADMWKFEAIGIIEDIDPIGENKKVIDYFLKTVQMKDNRIYIKFPFKPNKDKLSDNFKLALSRLHSLCKMRKNNSNAWTEYVKTIQNQIDQGILEEVTDIKSNNLTFYIPHQAVIKARAHKTKLRVVLDASSCEKGQLSLNDVTFQGPTMLANIVGILLRARLSKFVMTADIEKAFHQIFLQQSDRDVTRILWLHDTTKGPENGNLRILRFSRLPFGINASPYLLAMSINYFLNQKSNPLHQEIRSNMYVDDLTLGSNTRTELVQKYKESKAIFKDMGMPMREYLSNSFTVNSEISKKDLSTNQNPKLLGLSWKIEKDQLQIIVKMPLEENPTKRKALRACHSTYDPLGLTSPLLLQSRLFIQELWKRELDWDEHLPSELADLWKSICQSINQTSITIPRLAIFPEAKSIELHAFVDASSKAYAAVVYIVSESNQGERNSALCQSRYRLTPLKDLKNPQGISIPRLELMALTIGTQLVNFINDQINYKVTKIRVYSDSLIALYWTQGDNNQTFIKNRVNQINSIKESWDNRKISSKFEYVATDENPADLATRGVTKSQLNSFWWKGPPFLTDKSAPRKKAPEFDIKQAQVTAKILTVKVETYENLSQASSFKMMKEWAVKEIRKKKARKQCDDTLSEDSWNIIRKEEDPFYGEEIQVGEQFLIKLAQKTLSDKELQKLSIFDTFKDPQELFRCKGRLGKSNLFLTTREPILLPNDHWVTQSIIQDCHIKSGHLGVNGTLAKIREKFWIPRGRYRVKRTIGTCLECQTLNKPHFKYPKMSDLPTRRVTQSTRPFEHIGLDYAGPILVTDIVQDSLVKSKTWFCLFTCMSTRAIHMEMVPDVTAYCFLLALKRFMGLFGQPQSITSDNATTFKLGQKVIDHFLTPRIEEIDKFHQVTAEFQIKWYFISPLSPWKGGFYERLIRSVKEVLRKFKKLGNISSEEFRTALAETSMMVNSRPLTYISSKLDDIVILRPIDFLIPKIPVSKIRAQGDNDQVDDPNYRDVINTRENAIARLEATEQFLSKAWELWSTFYLTELDNYNKKTRKSHSARNPPQIGSIVLLVDPLKNRFDWKMAKIINLIKSEDGEVRSVALSTAKGKELIRPINLLVPLELEPKDVPESLKSIPPTRYGEEQVQTELIIPQTNQDNIKDSDKKTNASNNDKNMTQDQKRVLPRKAKENVTYTFTTQIEPRRKTGLSWNGVKLSLLSLIMITLAFSPVHAMNIHCKTGGAILQDLNTESITEICGGHSCHTFSPRALPQTVQFPPEITMNDYNVLVKQIFNGSESAFQIKCPAAPYCEQISCTFCADIVNNPHCWPRLALSNLALLFYGIIVTLYLCKKPIIKILKAIKQLIILPFSCYKQCTNILCCRDYETEQTLPFLEYSSQNIKFKASTMSNKMAVVITLVAIIASAQCCQDTIMMKGKIDKCGENSTDKCQTHETIQLSLDTVNQGTCVQLQDSRHNVNFQIKIKLVQVELTCIKQSMFYTQKREADVSDILECGRKCGTEGICKLDIEKAHPGYNITEQRHGNTYCADNGYDHRCLFVPSCILYRIFYTPNPSEPSFEIFKCPMWQKTITISIEIVKQDDKTAYSRKITLSPHEEFKFQDHRLVINQISTHPMPILSNRFASNDQITTMIEDQIDFPLKCGNVSDNGLDNCTVKDNCKCTFGTGVACHCEPNEIPMEIHSTAPAVLPYATFTAENDTVQVIPDSAGTLITLYLNTDSINSKTKIATDQCTAVVTPVQGCYSCMQGATGTITCKGKKSNSIGTLKCPTKSIAVSCSEEGVQSKFTVAAIQSDYTEICQFSCGIDSQTINLNGSLNYIHGIRPYRAMLRGAAPPHDPISSNGKWLPEFLNRSLLLLNFDPLKPIINAFWPVIKEHILSALMILGFTLIAILITVILIATYSDKTVSPPTRAAIGTTVPPLGVILIVLHFVRKIVKAILAIPLLLIRLLTKLLLKI